MFEASSTDPHRSHLARTAPTPGFRSTVAGTGSQGSHNSSTPRQEKCGVGRRGSQGCDNRIAQTNPRVSSNARETEARQPFAATNGHSASLGGSLETSQFSGRARTVSNLATQCTDPHETGRSPSQLLRSQPKRVAPIDRTECNARTNVAGVPQHGTATAYRNFYCRCPDAREDNRLKDKRRREHRHPPAYIDSTGTARRLQALACLGWTMNSLAPWFAARQHLVQAASSRGGMSASRINSLRRPTRPRIWVPQANLIDKLYQDLSMTYAPRTHESERLRRHAARNGWAPPAAWDNIDDTHELPQHQAEDTGLASEVEEYSELAELVAGHSKLNAEWLPTESPLDRERRIRLNSEAIRILEGHGLEATEIAGRLKLADRTVHRYRNLSAVGPTRDNATSTNQAEAPHSASTSERHHAA